MPCCSLARALYSALYHLHQPEHLSRLLMIKKQRQLNAKSYNRIRIEDFRRSAVKILIGEFITFEHLRKIVKCRYAFYQCDLSQHLIPIRHIFHALVIGGSLLQHFTASLDIDDYAERINIREISDRIRQFRLQIHFLKSPGDDEGRRIH